MARSWSFPPFRLDLGTGSLWRDDTWVPLPPKAFTVLATLVAQAGQVVTKEALFDAAWPDTAVTDGVLKGCIRQIRRALGERAGMASSIATVHRRGYRFCVPVTPVEGPLSGAAPEGRVAATAHAPRHPSWRRPRRASWDGRRSWRSYSSGGPRRVRAAGRWCSSPARRGLARPPSWMPSWPRWPPQRWCGAPAGSASSTTGRASRISPCWRRWGNGVGVRTARSWWPCCTSRRRRGWCTSRRWCRRPTMRRCSGGRGGPRGSACCASWPRRWRG